MKRLFIVLALQKKSGKNIKIKIKIRMKIRTAQPKALLLLKAITRSSGWDLSLPKSV